MSDKLLYALARTYAGTACHAHIDPGLGVVKRAALAGVLIVLLTAATVASAALLEVDQLVDIVRNEGQAIPGVKNVLDDVAEGGPRPCS